jgi:NAD+ synthase
MQNDENLLDINPNLARRILVDFIRSEIYRTGFRNAVIGLSGGLDSSLTCFLCAEALGPEHVLAIRMPYKTSSPDSLEHAAMVIDATGVQHKTIPITDMVDPLLALVPDVDEIRAGNIMSRMRMIVLYDQSVAFNGLVVGTGNKTEILLGYTTLFGDSACAINPLGDLYKTQTRQLAAACGVPEVVLKKPPSADLWQGQTDEDELGFTYEQADGLLYKLIDHRRSPEDCVELGFEPDLVAAVTARVRKYHFKRIQAPIAKLSNRTVGYDFLYPRDWGT